jgi:hypothetical protein
MNARGWWIATTAVLVALAAIAVAIVALRGDAVVEAGSPQAVVAAFVQAVVDRDLSAARELLTDEAASRCPAPAFARAALAATDDFGNGAPRWSFLLRERRDLASGAVQVRVQIVRTQVFPPFEVSEARAEHPFVLERSEAGYLVASFGWPGPCY